MVFCSPKRRRGFLFLAMFVVACAAAAQAPNAARPVGTIKSVSGNNIILTTDAGGDVTVVVQDAAKLVRVEPGQKDLKEAVPIELKELLAGDRILVRGQLAEDGKTVLATAVIAMKKASIAEKQAREREEWRRQGTSGLVSGVDPAANKILIVQQGTGEKKTVTVHISKDTILRRYAPDSVKFDDAKPAGLEQIKPGDQLRARGTRSADGSELLAAEIVSEYRGNDFFDRCFGEQHHRAGPGDEETRHRAHYGGFASSQAAAADGPGHCRTLEKGRGRFTGSRRFERERDASGANRRGANRRCRGRWSRWTGQKRRRRRRLPTIPQSHAPGDPRGIAKG